PSRSPPQGGAEDQSTRSILLTGWKIGGLEPNATPAPSGEPDGAGTVIRKRGQPRFDDPAGGVSAACLRRRPCQVSADGTKFFRLNSKTRPPSSPVTSYLSVGFWIARLPFPSRSQLFMVPDRCWPRQCTDHRTRTPCRPPGLSSRTYRP